MIHPWPIFLMILPFAGALVVLLLALGPAIFSRLLALGILLIGLLFSVFLYLGPISSGEWNYNLGGWPPPWGIEIRINTFLCLMAGLVFFISFLTLLCAENKPTKESPSFPGILDGLWLLATGSLIGLLLTRDAFTIYLFLELFVVAAGVFIGLGGSRAWLSAFRFTFWGSVGASFYLLGLAYLYAATGTLHLDDLLAQLLISKNFNLIWTAGVFLTTSFGFPLIFSTPAVFAGFFAESYPLFLIFLGSVMVRVMVFLLFVFYFSVLGIPGLSTPLWLAVLEQLTAVFFLVNFWKALQEKEMGRVAAYLSAGSLGYVFIGFELGTSAALTGTLLEILNQILAVAGLFFVSIWMKKTGGMDDGRAWAGLGWKKPQLAAAFLLFGMGLIGVPPLGGFYGKLYLFQAAFHQHQWFLAGVLLAAYGLGLTYLGKTVGELFFPPGFSRKKVRPIFLKDESWKLSSVIVVLALGLLALGIFHRSLAKNAIVPALPKAFQNLNLPAEPFSGQEVE
jgi:multicomponent Na+:H+ antiporter subunit D